jgi:hypothetical protein
MIEFKTTMPGKKSLFGDARALLGEYDLQLGGGWEFDEGMFDSILWQKDDDKIYLRMPFFVVDGMLDEDSALIEFGKPFIIRHVLNVGLDDEDTPILAAVGLDQFKKPDNPDAPIANSDEWVAEAQKRVELFSESPMFIAPYL